MASVRFELPPRLVDWTLLAAVSLALLTGIVSLTAGSARQWWVFFLHGAAGLTLTVLLFWKLRRVRHRLRGRSVTVALSALLAVVTLAALASGVGWVLGIGADLDIWGWTLLNLHIGLGLLVVPLLGYHLLRRARPPTRADWEGRRTVLQYAALVVGGALVWRVQQALGAALGADRRFTGSRPEGGSGNRFPVTSWVLDDPDPIDPDDWRLHVVGRVDRPLEADYGALSAATPTDRSAILDCTSGWYVDRDWRGVGVGDLLDEAAVEDDARWVTFHSVTGYRFGFPIEEARDLLLATHVDGERLTHGHGFPLRVVAPDRRGFQWVKWVTAVEVRETRDWGQWLAIFVSGFDGS